MSAASSVSNEMFLEGGGIMGALIRAKDWTKTPLGKPSEWPQSLKTCIRIVLTSRQPMFVWWGPDLINIYNDAYLSIVGGKHPESLGQPASEVWKEIWSEIYPRTKKVLDENIGTYDEALLLLMERNGYTEETYYTFSYSPVPGDDGTTQGIICANTDDTQKIIGARQLQTLKELAKNLLNIKTNQEIYQRVLQALADNPQDFPFVLLYEVSDDGNTLNLVNQSSQELPENMKHSTIALSGRSDLYELQNVIATGNMQEVKGVLSRFGALPTTFWDEAPDQALLIPILQNNHKFPFAILAVGVNPYRLLDDKYLSFFALIADQIANALTNSYAFKQERKRAESLAEIDKAKIIFFSNISHEFRTPLTLMLGPLEELLKKESKYDISDKENIEVAHRNAMRLLRLVNTLLDFSRIESGRIQANFQPLLLADFTANLASTFRSIMEKAGLTLEIQTTLDAAVYVDKEMWEKIVLNLLSNAFKFTLKGKIIVSLSEEDGHAVFAVSDSGTGIPEKEIAHLFERFYRVNNSAGRTYEGTGIGLSLVKELVELHHGTVEVQSKMNCGTTFTIKIPMGRKHLSNDQIADNAYLDDVLVRNAFIKEAQGMVKEGLDENLPTASHEKPSLLIVDDNTDMQRYIRTLLEKDFHTTIAFNGKEALEKIALATPDLIVSDIMMPVMNGIELLQTLKSDPIKKRIPVLLLSARAGEEAKIAGYDLGADDYLVKPFSAKELLARVQSQLRIAKSRNHAESQLKNVFMQAPGAISILRGHNFVVEMANDRILELWGKTSEEILHRPIFQAVPEMSGRGFEEQLKNVFRSGDNFMAPEFPMEVRRNGNLEKIFVKFFYEPLYDDAGEITGVMVLADEITQHVEARIKLENSETRNKLAIEAAKIGNFEWDILSSDFIYSDRLAQIFGYDGNAKLTHENFTNRIHPEDFQIRTDAVKEAIQTGVLFYEARIVLPDDSIRWIRLNGKVIFDEIHKPEKMFGTVLDVTDQRLQAIILEEKVAQRTNALNNKNRQLRESEERYQRMTEEVEDYAIILLDTEGNVLNWNKGAQKIKGYLDKEILGKNFRLFYRDEDRKMGLPEKFISEARKNGRATNEGYRLRKDGSIFWGMMSITALHDNQNNIIGFSKVTRDLTERKIAEDKMQKYYAELEFQNKELEQFAYVASHDLQEPLRKIQMFTGLLEQNIHDEQIASKYFSKIITSAERMSDLIKAVLNYSRLSRNDQQFEWIDMNAILENVLVDFELLIEEKGAVIIKDKLLELHAIPLQINQLFSNLIGNSLKFSETSPEISITSRTLAAAEIPFETNLAEGNYLELVFKDNGIGFEQKYASRIFTIFQRLNDKASFSGTGIGLALCKKIVENHAGFITAKSALGEGTSFFIYLPMISA